MIQPSNAASVTLNFGMFDFVGQFGGDTLFIYDGPSTASPLLSFIFGNANPSPITSSGGAITIRQKTDWNATNPGFIINWSCTLVGLDEYEDLNSSVVVYPNPTTDFLNVQIDQNLQFDIKSIQLFNMMGQLQEVVPIDENNSTHLLDVSGISKGVYLLHIATQKGNIVKKVTIQ